ncbi:MAG: SDR family NAD(P)-dependent oxidoreductase [Promethearchaeota archaeon]|jgi:3-oxoacyl-[acyl-carrier protein] reductase
MCPKNILITGSGSGLGRAMAIRLAKEGYNIILNGRTESKLVETEKMLNKYSITSLIKAGDVSDSDFVSTMISEIVTDMKELHCVINNAGISGIGLSILEISEESMQKVMDINFKGAWLVSKYAANAMRAQRSLKPLRGKIINVSSIAGLEPMPSIGIYSCSKAAMISLTKVLAKELAPIITANAICPGYHITPIYNNDPNLIQNFWNLINMKPLLRRVGTVEDVTGLISYLVSDDSNYMTGQVISICGGVILH